MSAEAERAVVPSALSPWRTASARERARRRRLLLAVLLAFLAVSAVFGFPTGREVITGWVLLVLLAACAGDWRVWRRVVLHDWLALMVTLFAYDLLRGLADQVGGRLFRLPVLYNGKLGGDLSDSAHVLPPLHADEALFGGQVPTVWLQHHFYDPQHVHWYDVATVPVYFSHFVVSLGVAVVLWAVRYDVFRRYVWTLVTLTALTLSTYALYPAAPPWMASLNGYLPRGLDRVVPHTLAMTGVGTVNSAVERGQTYANAVAAMPSLHGGIPMMLLLFSWPLVGRWVRAGLALYVGCMALTLVYAAEHYATDILIGWVYAAVSVGLVALVFRRREARRHQAPRRAVDLPEQLAAVQPRP